MLDYNRQPFWSYVIPSTESCIGVHVILNLLNSLHKMLHMLLKQDPLFLTFSFCVLIYPTTLVLNLTKRWISMNTEISISIFLLCIIFFLIFMFTLTRIRRDYASEWIYMIIIINTLSWDIATYCWSYKNYSNNFR